jgi:transglutaminase-like putative cysteine protease
VTTSYNEARLTPLTIEGQTTLDSRIEVSPPAALYRYWDYWGSQVTAFDVHEEHEVLEVVATSVVETSGPTPAPEPVGWAVLADPDVRVRRVETLVPTRLTAVDAELVAAAGDLRAGDPHTTAHAVAGWVHENVAYVSGSTGVRTSAEEAWQLRKGVCQDIAHLTVGMLRALGIPARYVSGYLHPTREAVVGVAAAGQSHAWVEWWVGAWTAWDPTNDSPVGERHVLVARGRDYDDVPPLKGVYRGAPSTALGVQVDVERLA